MDLQQNIGKIGRNNMDIKELRASTRMTQKAFAEYFNIPVRTLQDWEGEKRTPPEYVTELIKYKIEKEELGKMKKNKNGKYDVLNLSSCEWFEVDDEWLENVNLQGAVELRYTSGTKEELEVCLYNGTSCYYENIHGSWARNY